MRETSCLEVHIFSCLMSGKPFKVQNSFYCCWIVLRSGQTNSLLMNQLDYQPCFQKLMKNSNKRSIPSRVKLFKQEQIILNSYQLTTTLKELLVVLHPTDHKDKLRNLSKALKSIPRILRNKNNRLRKK